MRPTCQQFSGKPVRWPALWVGCYQHNWQNHQEVLPYCLDIALGRSIPFYDNLLNKIN